MSTRPEIHFSATDHWSLPTKPNIEILIVESNPADTRLTCEAFKAAGVTSELRCVSDGADALMYVRRQGKYANATTPDLIFLDLSLPKVSGLEVLKEIKATPELRHIPIVVASGSEDPEDVRAVYALNGNCFMRKPQELTQFLRFVETCYQFWGNVVTLNPKLGAAQQAKVEAARVAVTSGAERPA